MTYDFDIVVLGGGPGGYEAAIRCAQLGRKTCLIEARELGGTCLNRGCIPTKALLHGAEVYESVLSGGTFGIHAENVSIDYAKLVEFKNARVARLRGGIEALERANGVEVIHGFGRFTAPHRIQVGDRMVTFDRAILAMGSAPARPPIPGIENTYTSDDVLAADYLVNNVIVVGGGVIGLEFATLFSALGKRVTIIEMMEDILPGVIPEITSKVKAILKKKKVEFLLGARVQRIQNGRTVEFEMNGKTESRAAGAVIVCIGRKPMTADCGLEHIGITPDRRGFIEVDDHMRTSAEGVYAIGDITGKIQLAHAATAQGMIAAANCAGGDAAMDYTIVPACVYTDPEIAMVGLSQNQAEQQGLRVQTGVFNIAANGRCMVMDENQGLIKLVADAENGKILGCQIMAPRATDMIAEIVAVMRHGGTVESLSDVIHPHPTVSEIIAEAAHDAEGLCINAMPRKL